MTTVFSQFITSVGNIIIRSSASDKTDGTLKHTVYADVDSDAYLVIETENEIDLNKMCEELFNDNDVTVDEEEITEVGKYAFDIYLLITTLRRFFL